jgi:hypothetical protein
MAKGYLVFHLNLAFSSIKEEARVEVIQRCYWPLLRFTEHTGIPTGIELTGWTLQQIERLDSTWIEHFRQMLKSKQCELIGSGWSQMIGPIVPYDVNLWNQKLGLDAYVQMLGVKPKLALVNEMAYSTGMVDVYKKSGYEGILMERDNVRMALGLEHTSLSEMPTHALGTSTCSLPVLWTDSILFQRLQRVVHGDIPVADYLDYVKQRAEHNDLILPIYSNDVEIFDYRPGRFTAESRLHTEGEWVRFERVCRRLKEDIALEWLSPSDALTMQLKITPMNPKRLTSVRQPIPVKKQAKYNINRWAVTGRDDLWLNTQCHQIYQLLAEKADVFNDDWQELCELWASDLRTHITDERWEQAVKRVDAVQYRLGLKEFSRHPALNTDYIPLTGVRFPFSRRRQLLDFSTSANLQITQDEEGIFWTIKTESMHIILNARRGLTIKSLGFKSHDYEPIIGTLAQGYFNTIGLSTDFYSGGLLIEVPGERNRVTDLEWVTPIFRQEGTDMLISAVIPTALGTIEKTITINFQAQQVQLRYDFQQFERPLGIVRVGIVTLLPEAFSLPLYIHMTNGGLNMECYKIDTDIHYGHAVSTQVSSTTAFGATDGRLVIEDAVNRKFSLSWDPSRCAATPMLKNKGTSQSQLTRILFSLCELDDTSRSGGRLLPFTVTLKAE